jgi:hypothetical protein
MLIHCRLLLVSILAAFSVDSRASDCLDPAIPHGTTQSTVQLATKIPSPYFYYRSFDDDFAILVAPQVVTNFLESASAKGNHDAEKLLAAVRKDMPLTQSIDLFRYVLADYYRFSFVQRMLVELLNQHKVSVFDAETGELQQSVALKIENLSRARSRTFYDSNRSVLLYSLDCVED